MDGRCPVMELLKRQAGWKILFERVPVQRLSSGLSRLSPSFQSPEIYRGFAHYLDLPSPFSLLQQRPSVPSSACKCLVVVFDLQVSSAGIPAVTAFGCHVQCQPHSHSKHMLPYLKAVNRAVADDSLFPASG